MKQLVYGCDTAVWHWANRFFAEPLNKPDWAIGIVDSSGELVGALIGEELTPSTVELTLCGENGITLPVAKQFFAFVFERYWRLEVRTTEDNLTVRRNAPKWGFTYELTAEDYWGPRKSALVYRMLRSECRFIHGSGGALQTPDSDQPRPQGA